MEKSKMAVSDVQKCTYVHIFFCLGSAPFSPPKSFYAIN